MNELLDQLISKGILSPLDKHFALTIARFEDNAHRDVVLAAAFASRAVQRGHVCADLAHLQEGPWVTVDEDPGEAIALPPFEQWCETLRESSVVATTVDPENPRPLVLDASGRLFMYRYALYQKRLADQIRARASVSVAIDSESLKEGLQRLFPEQTYQVDDKQRLGALLSVLRLFTIISGGPGTGKTYTVAKILALLQEQNQLADKEPLRILLLAPTGKAAQRLGQSITDSIDSLPCSEQTKAAIPRTASTIHRALGYNPQSPTRFRHDQKNPLPADVVLVDEASMVDMALMTKLIDAVPTTGRLILLGDKDQLASVEAGAILGDICSAGDNSPVGDSTVGAGIRDCMIHLTRSHRYQEKSGIGELAQAINDGNPDAAVEILRRGKPKGGVSLHGLHRDADLEAALGKTILSAFKDLKTAGPAEKLEILSRFRILSAHRHGHFGTIRLNQLAEKILSSNGLLETDRDWYEARPLIVTANDYQLNLFNGDVGVIARAESGGPLEAYFAGTDSHTLRHFPPARLPSHETVFAMTVHKSQGSEFDHIALLLPDQVSPILTRELIYTAVTRARSHVDIYANADVLREAIARRVRRASGLRDALWPLPAAG